jgi:protein-disulfide isomerase
MSFRSLVVLFSLAGLPAFAQQPPAGAPVAQVNGEPIAAADIEKGIEQDLAKLEQQLYDLKRKQIDTVVEDRLIAQEAKKRGVSVDALVATEITAKAPAPTAEEVATFYGANQARLQGDLEKWKPEITKFLQAQRMQARRKEFATQLRAAADVKVLLPSPRIFRADVNVAGAFAKGNAAAPVTIVEFSDFHCPFCKRVQPAITEVLTKYGDRVRLVYKDMPIDSLHPQARAAAEAARCAGEQDKFWPFHDKVYAGPSDGTQAQMTIYAKEVGLDIEKFEACRASRKYQAQVQKDVDEGAKLGVNGTPGFFINGRFLSGAQPVDAFARVIDDELAASAKK